MGNKIMKGETLRIFQGPGGSELERDFTYIDDIVRGTVAAVDHIGSSVKPAPCKVYNLGNRNPESVTHLVNLIEENLGKKAIREYIPLPETGDVLRTHADISLFVEWYNTYYKDGLDADMLSYTPL